MKFAIVGGGLSGCLTALYLKKNNFNDFVIVEKAPTFGGDHTWSFMDSDLAQGDHDLLAPFTRAHWPEQVVTFPKFQKKMSLGYNSIRSSDLHRHMISQLSKDQFLLESECHWDFKTISTDNETFNYEILLDARERRTMSLEPAVFKTSLVWILSTANPTG
ncbi:MAG: lycopene cyclase family protein [Bdellovibrionales bacterium]